MNWWRVELDGEGSVLKCEQVEAGKLSGPTVTYVRANTNAEACSEAKRWHERYKEHQRAASAARRAAFVATETCTKCGAERVPGRVLCAKHLEADRESRERIRNGIKRKPRLSAERAKANQLYSVKRTDKLRVSLLVIREEFDKRGPERFREWLDHEIAMRDVEVYADYPVAAE